MTQPLGTEGQSGLFPGSHGRRYRYPCSRSKRPVGVRPAGRYILRRLFAELFGTFLLVLAGAGAGVVNARFGGHAIPSAAQVVVPGLMVMSVILFMGAVSGAHLNPVVSIAFALRNDFAWKRVPAYVVAQFAGALLAMELLVLLLGRQGTSGLTLPGPGVSTALALGWENLSYRRACERDTGHCLGCAERGLGGGYRCGRVHRAGRTVWLPGERGLHESGSLAGAGHDPWRLHGLVGLCGRTYLWVP